MAITVKHTKVSTIPDGDDSSLIRPSDWNDDHQLTGTVPVANGGTGAATLTGYVKGNGTAAMTASATVPSTDITGLGTMSAQNANSVAVTGGTVSNTTLTNDTVSNNLNFTSTTAPSYLEGRVWYDSTEKALAFYNDSSALAVHMSQDLIFKVINNTGSTIPNGSPVYITGTSSGQTYPNVALAKADVAATSSVIGLTNGAIANGAFGYVSSQGTIDNVNTSTFTVGQVLYLSPYSAGQLMNTIPPTGITVQVGVATYIDSSAGHIYVKQTTPLAVPASIITGTLGVDHGGTGQTSYTDGQLLIGNSTGNTLTKSTLTAGTGISVTNSAGGITIANTSPSSGGTVTSVTAGTGLSGGTITTSGTIALANTTVSAGSYTNSSITVDAQGRLTSASSGTAPVTSVTGTSPVVSSGGTTPAISLATGYGDTQNPYASKTANNFLAAPNGSAGSPTFRAIVAADIPTLNQNTTGSAATLTTGRTIAITGDLAYTSPSFDGSTNVTAAGTLATVNSNVGTFTKITVNGKGLATAASQASLTDLSSPTAAFSMGSQNLTNLLDPVNAQDAATKLYVDNTAQGLDAKASVVAATTVSITLVGGQTIDGVTVVAGDRVLVKNQSSASANGIYIVQTTAWTRSTDMDTWAEVPNAYVWVEGGTTQADTGWVCTSNAGGTLGTTAITWVQFAGAGSYTAGTGLTLTGTQFAIDSTVATLTGSQTLTNKTISGASNTLSNIGNSSLTNSAITINGTSTSLGGSISVGTVTSVTGTSPVVSSGGNTPAISMPAATTSVSGYLTSTDWTTFNNKGSGTVTSVSGTTGNITSTGGTTPVINLASGVATAGTTGSATLIPVVTIDTYGRVTGITTAANPQGTVTSVTGTAPVVSSGGATPAISMAAANTTTNGYLTSTDWNTFNGKGSGTVTSVAALTLGTTGTDLSSTVATGTTTPVITLQVPTASATNRGALSSTDWTTFNNKAPATTYTTSYIPYGQGTTTLNQSSSLTFATSTLTAPIVNASNGLHVNSNTVSASYSIPSGSSAMSTGPMTVASGQTVTVASGSRWVVL